MLGSPGFPHRAVHRPLFALHARALTGCPSTRRDPPDRAVREGADDVLDLPAAPGKTRTSWLAGAAPWAYISATQYILGRRPEIDGLRIDPCIPNAWDGFTATRRFRGKDIEIQVANPNHVCRGVKAITLNGDTLADNLVPADRLQGHNRVEVVLR